MPRHTATATLTALFLFTNVLGLLAGTRLSQETAVQAAATQYQAPAAGVYFVGMIAAATVILLALYRYGIDLIIKLWFGTALFATTAILYSAFLPGIPAAALAAVTFAARFRVRSRQLRNLLDTVPFAGAAALIGSLVSLPAAYVFLVLLAAYDYAAVYLSEHMIALAKAGAATDTFMGFTYDKGRGTTVEDMEDMEMEPAAQEPAGDDASDAGGRRVGMLGGGDVIVPAVFATATAATHGLGAGLLVVGGAAAALVVLFTHAPETEFVPAIPVVGTGTLVGFIIARLPAVL